MLKRTLTGILIIAVVAGFVALRMVHTAFFDAFVFALMIAAGFEMIRAKKKAGKVLFERLIILFPIPVAAGYIFVQNLAVSLLIEVLSIVVLFVASVGIELIINAVNRKSGAPAPENDKLLAITKDTMGVIIYPLAVISTMFILNHFGYNIGYVMIITMFAITMTTDTFAYLFGMLFGRRQNSARFAPEISPKKSMAGFYAGIAGGLIVSVVCWLLFYHYNLFDSGLVASLSTSSSLILFTVTGIVASLATQFGDLLASAVKRQADLKDYSNLLPGHGGVMDRIDGEMFSSAVVATMFALFLLI
ncbi:MAG: phosphatidate cytidylyltransferase [Clostridia bacterium]|nr:phosphatidate cytidylyltransferase [Clostridia bacterium]